jgi:hypothetical protein
LTRRDDGDDGDDGVTPAAHASATPDVHHSSTPSSHRKGGASTRAGGRRSAIGEWCTSAQTQGAKPELGGMSAGWPAVTWSMGPPLSPKQLDWMEAALSAFENTPLTPKDQLSSMLLVNIYVRGTAQLTANLLTGDAAVLEAARQADRLYAQRLAMLATPDRFPSIAANLAGGRLEDFDADYSADEFQVGLDVVLDGIQQLIDRRYR